jgi:hypothetical protein
VVISTQVPSRIHFAEQDEYTFNVEGGATNNGAKIIGWAGPKGANDEWWVKAFNDFST